MQQMIAERITLKSLTESDDPISEEKIISWLVDSGDIEFSLEESELAGVSPQHSLTIDESDLLSSYTVFNLDPASAGVLIAGLSAILAWVSTERRHKETLGGASSSNGGNDDNDSGSPDVCKKIEEEKMCKLPLSNTMRVKGDGFLILFRACTKKPEPHTTVEYYEL